VKKFIYASTGGAVYGEPANLPVDETCWPHPICHYGVSKYTVEHYAFLYNHLYNLRYTILRYPNIYGPRQNPHGEAGVCAILIGLMLEGKIPTLYGNGKPLRDYVYVGDIARANVIALSKANGETINLGSGKGTSVLAIFNALRDLLNFPHEPIMKPLRAGEVNQIYITGDRAASLLGWKAEVDLKEGLARTLEHIRSKR
jgi:UDP-glucose 4-epimerase